MDDTFSPGEPILIERFPILKPKLIIINIWKTLIIDIIAAGKYEKDIPSEDMFSEHNTHDIVLSLLSWSELENHYEYPTNVQKTGKVFIHFPIYGNSVCKHIYVEKTICNKIPCGFFVPFFDMKTVVGIIDGYMNTGKRILLYSQNNIHRMLLFVACSMIQYGYDVIEIVDNIKVLGVEDTCLDYVKAYGKYLAETC